MKILYLSVLSSNRIIEELYRSSGHNPGFAIQKFNRLLAKGIQDNEADLTILSALPISRRLSSKVFWNISSEQEDGLFYHYLPFVNYPVIRQICLTISTFFKVIIWSLDKTKQKIVLCDVLNTSICLGALVACKMSRTSIAGFVTDMPGLLVGVDAPCKWSFTSLISSLVSKSYLSSYDKYIFLTKAMNDVINNHHKPYIVMEGICDPEMAISKKKRHYSKKRTILYAGGVYARYGLEILVKAIAQIDPDACELIIYGSGPFVKELREKYCVKYPNIIYMGVVLNSEIVQAELEADILINPRPTKEDFTKYSFPSKNIEYMASGTPLITTKLPGMPTDYYPYVFLIEDETEEGYVNAIRKILLLSDDELFDFGEKAKQFILINKNRNKQGERVLDLFRS